MCCLLNFCSSSNNLYMNATLNSGGFSPGENIDVVIQATNKSDKDVREFTVKLSKVREFLKILGHITDLYNYFFS